MQYHYDAAFCIYKSMGFYWVKTRWFIKKIFPRFVWDMPNNERTIYLTFDDGPTPEVTDWVLDILREHDIRATFFCIGNNIEKHPDIFMKVVNAGHAIGNHTFNHILGWNTDNKTYQENADACDKSILSRYPAFESAKLFRPPYGRMKAAQAKAMIKKGYRIIMWDVLAADFDREISTEQCLDNVIRHAEEGSIIIFHDSVKAYENLRYALPKAIAYLKEKNFRFGKIS